jgi:uncharacterized membrane protein (DUF2068 family)
MRSVDQPERRGADESALRVILVYKLVKGSLLVLSSLLLTLAVLLGYGGKFQDYAAMLHAHATRAWALHASELLSRLATVRWLRWSSVALALDGGINLVEAWALEKRHAWGPWLVVAVTGLFLPVEVWELWRHPRPSRVSILVGNLAILVYLTWYARRHERRPALPPAPG